MTRQERIEELKAQRNAINDELLELITGAKPDEEEPEGDPQEEDQEPPQAPPMQFRTREPARAEGFKKREYQPKHDPLYSQGAEVQHPPANDQVTRRPVGAEVTGHERDANGWAIPGVTDPRFY